MSTIFTPENTDVPLDPDEFRVVAERAGLAALGRLTESVPNHGAMTILFECGGAETITMSDHPMNRASDVIDKHYVGRDFEREGAVRRFLAFQDIKCLPGYARWTKPDPKDPDGDWLHPAVLEAAATVRLEGVCNFPAKEFFQVVERIAREKYPDLD